MAIRLSFDTIGSTCGDLLRFADAVRAAGTEPDVPLRQSGPNRIDVFADGHPGGPPQRHGPYLSPGHGYLSAPEYVPPMVGGRISVNWGTRSRETPMSIETVDQLRAVLDTVLRSADIDDTVRAALRNLREAFSDHEMPPGYQGGS